MKTLTIKAVKLIMTFVMMIVLNVACSGPEEDFKPIQQELPEEQTQVAEETEVTEEEEELEVELPVRLTMEFEGHDFSDEKKKGYSLENYTQSAGDKLEINLVRVVNGVNVMYRVPGRGWDEATSYNVFFTLPNEENPYPGFEISVSSGSGEKYDKVIVEVRNGS